MYVISFMEDATVFFKVDEIWLTNMNEEAWTAFETKPYEVKTWF